MNFPDKCKELAQDRANDRIAEVISLAQDYVGEFAAFRNSHNHHKPDCMKNLFAIRNMPYVEVWCECTSNGHVQVGRMIKPYDRYRGVPFFQALVGPESFGSTRIESGSNNINAGEVIMITTSSSTAGFTFTVA